MMRLNGTMQDANESWTRLDPAPSRFFVFFSFFLFLFRLSACGVCVLVFLAASHESKISFIENEQIFRNLVST